MFLQDPFYWSIMLLFWCMECSNGTRNRTTSSIYSSFPEYETILTSIPSLRNPKLHPKKILPRITPNNSPWGRLRHALLARPIRRLFLDISIFILTHTTSTTARQGDQRHGCSRQGCLRFQHTHSNPLLPTHSSLSLISSLRKCRGAKQDLSKLSPSTSGVGRCWGWCCLCCWLVCSYESCEEVWVG